MKKVLVTGGAGFVGHHLIEHILKNTEWNIVSLDRLSTSGNLNRLASIDSWSLDKHRVKVVYHNLQSPISEQLAKQLRGPFDYIMHLAAGSHVDRSIEDPLSFFQDNCIGTVNLLNYARNGGLKKAGGGEALQGKFHYFSTDEVYGPAPLENFTGYKEWDRHNPNNPYAAAKSAAEMAVISFANTYRIPCFITNTMNIFGERQHPEKFLPLVINKTLKGEILYVHADKSRKHAGSRHYLHARNISAASLYLLQHGDVLDGSGNAGRYNIVGDIELDNLTFAKKIEGIVRDVRPEAPPLAYELVDFHSSRPGHDLRYALDGTLLKESGFSYPVSFDESLRSTVEWMLAHEEWL